jgi:hypothetical protein
MLARKILCGAMLLVAMLGTGAGAATWTGYPESGKRSVYSFAQADGTGYSDPAVKGCPAGSVSLSFDAGTGAQATVVQCEEASDTTACDEVVSFTADQPLPESYPVGRPFLKVRRDAAPSAGEGRVVFFCASTTVAGAGGGGSGSATTVASTDAFLSAVNADVTGGKVVELAPGTFIDAPIVAPTMEADTNSVLEIRCPAGSGFRASDDDAATGQYNVTTSMEMEVGLTTSFDMSITDAVGSFTITAAGANFTTAGFEVGQKVVLTGFGTTTDAENFWVVNTVGTTTIVLDDPTNIVTANVALDSVADEQVYARRRHSLMLDPTNVGHDAEIIVDGCYFEGTADADVAILVRRVPGSSTFRLRINRPTVQGGGWGIGDAVFAYEQGMSAVNTVIVDAHIEGTSTAFDYHHLATAIAGMRLDVQGGFLFNTIGPCLDAANSNSPTLPSQALSTRITKFRVASGVCGWRFGAGSSVFMDVVHEAVLINTSPLAAMVTMVGSGTLDMTYQLSGSAGAGTAKPWLHTAGTNTAANVFVASLKITDRRCSWFSASIGGQLVTGVAGSTGGLAGLYAELDIAPACTRHATFIDATGMNTAARGLVVDAAARRTYQITGTTTPVAIIEPLGDAESGIVYYGDTDDTARDTGTEVCALRGKTCTHAFSQSGADLACGALPAADAESGDIYYGDTDDAARDTGTEVCALRGMTCTHAYDTAGNDDTCAGTVTPLFGGNVFLVACQDQSVMGGNVFTVTCQDNP